MCDEFIGLACDNRASSQPLPRFGVFPVFPESRKVNGRPSFMAKSERQLRLSRFAPFVKSVRRNQTAALDESPPVGEQRSRNLV